MGQVRAGKAAKWGRAWPWALPVDSLAAAHHPRPLVHPAPLAAPSMPGTMPEARQPQQPVLSRDGGVAGPG